MRSIPSILAALILILASATLVRSDTLDNAEAAKRGVPVDVILLERRVAELEKMNKLLLQRIAALEKALLANGGSGSAPAATAPADETPVAKVAPEKADTDLETVLNKMPDEFRPANTDTEIKKEQRDKQRAAWLKANVAGKTMTISMKVHNVDSVGNVSGYCYINYSGRLESTSVMCKPGAISKAKALSLDKDQEIEVQGKVSSYEFSFNRNDSSLSLLNCSFK